MVETDRTRMMNRFWTFLFFLLICSILIRFPLPLSLLHFCGRVFYHGLKQEADLLSRGWAILLIEFIIYGGSKVMNKFFARGLVVDILPRAKQNAVSQTSGQWLKKMRRQDRIQTEVSRAAREELRRTKQHRLTLIKKYRLKSTHIKNDAESKTKLMASVNKKVVSLALTVDGLMNRIQEKRFILDRQREDNKRVLQRYEQLYNDIQNRYIYE